MDSAPIVSRGRNSRYNYTHNIRTVQCTVERVGGPQQSKQTPHTEQTAQGTNERTSPSLSVHTHKHAGEAAMPSVRSR